VASEPQALDSIPLIRRKRAGDSGQDLTDPTPSPPYDVRPSSSPPPRAVEQVRPQETAEAGALRMKARETVQLAAVHVRIPEQLARGLRLMSVLEGRQAQVIVAEMLEEHLTRWNSKWRESVPPREA
jgi:hypothetical protein